jgi:TPP-dependent pyruvate/acetoin dehydrogenase alpha subunit
MITKLSEKDLVSFEKKVAKLFNSGKIRAPIHLYSGNEMQMIQIFSEVRKEDWVFCSWRSHYQCLLKGVPSETVINQILEGRSISLCFPSHRIFSSAIVGGNIPIAVGIGMAIKRRGGSERVHCFIGDMTAETGIAHECIKYCTNHDLPLRFIIEDNGISVCTDTKKTWGIGEASSGGNKSESNVVRYKYDLGYPHSGAGIRVEF